MREPFQQNSRLLTDWHVSYTAIAKIVLKS